STYTSRSRRRRIEWSEKLTSLYKMPRDVHKKIMDDFFSQLTHYLNGEGRSGTTEIIEGFFRHLFPLVYDYVIVDSSKTAHGGREFHALPDEPLHRCGTLWQPAGAPREESLVRFPAR
ncbi:glypican-5, partial [Biomphalaria pfeifferi]